MIRPLLSLERLSLDERDGQVGYHYGKGAGEMERMDYLEFIARVTSHIPDKGQVTVRYYGLYANAHRGKVKKASLGPFPLRMVEEELRPFPSRGWAEMIRKVYEVDPIIYIRSSFSAGLADRTFARKFFLIPSLGMINRGVVGCQIELKPGERGRQAADKPRSLGNQPDLSCRQKRESRRIFIGRHWRRGRSTAL
jgi:hypothetical protein